VSRFRSSHQLAAPRFANFGIEGHQQLNRRIAPNQAKRSASCPDCVQDYLGESVAEGKGLAQRHACAHCAAHNFKRREPLVLIPEARFQTAQYKRSQKWQFTPARANCSEAPLGVFSVITARRPDLNTVLRCINCIQMARAPRATYAIPWLSKQSPGENAGALTLIKLCLSRSASSRHRELYEKRCRSSCW